MKQSLYYSCLLTFLIPCSLIGFEKIEYSFSCDPIDVVIPCHPKDALSLERCIKGVKKNVINLRRIIVISEYKFTDSAEWASEALFPFTKESIMHEALQSDKMTKQYLEKKPRNTSWIYQQFLKLFAAYYIPNISSNILIVDADVVFLKPVSFTQENGAGLYATASSYYYPYFEHAAKIMPGLKRFHQNYSGIVHHMLFQREVLDDLYSLIEHAHSLEPWKAIARSMALNPSIPKHEYVISEYEIYFNFVLARTDQVKIRNLRWDDISEKAYIRKLGLQKYDYVAIHIRPLK